MAGMIQHTPNTGYEGGWMKDVWQGDEFFVGLEKNRPAVAPWTTFMGDPDLSPGGDRELYNKSKSDMPAMPRWINRQPDQVILSRIEALMYFGDRNPFYELLPIQEVQGADVVWNEFIADPALARNTPELAPGHMVSTSTVQRRQPLTRKAIGFQIEHGFMFTQMGILTYRMNIIQLANARMEGDTFDMVRALLNFGNFYQEWERKANSGKVVSIREILRRSMDQFDAFKQGQDDWWYIIDTKSDDIASAHGVQFDTYVVPIEISSWFTEVDPQQKDYEKKGQYGVDNLLRGARAFTTLRGKRVYVAPSFPINETGQMMNVFQESTAHGEFYDFTVSDAELNDYKTSYISRALYDENHNSYFAVSPQDCLAHCHLFGDDGFVRPLSELPHKDVLHRHYTVEQLADQFAFMAEGWNDQYSDKDGTNRENAYDKVFSKIRAVPVMGAISNKHQPMSHIKAISEGRVAKMNTDIDEVNRALMVIDRYQKIMSSYPELAVRQWLTAIGEGNAQTINPTSLYGTRDSQYNTGLFGGIDAAAYDGLSSSLPAMNLTYYVSKQMQLMYARLENANEFIAKGKSQFKEIIDATNIIEMFVHQLTPMFPNNVLLDPRYASFATRSPTSVDVIWDSLIVKEGYGVFRRLGGGAQPLPANFVPARRTGAAQNTSPANLPLSTLQALKTAARNAYVALAAKVVNNAAAAGNYITDMTDPNLPSTEIRGMTAMAYSIMIGALVTTNNVAVEKVQAAHRLFNTNASDLLGSNELITTANAETMEKIISIFREVVASEDGLSVKPTAETTPVVADAVSKGRRYIEDFLAAAATYEEVPAADQAQVYTRTTTADSFTRMPVTLSRSQIEALALRDPDLPRSLHVPADSTIPDIPMRAATAYQFPSLRVNNEDFTTRRTAQTVQFGLPLVLREKVHTVFKALHEKTNGGGHGDEDMETDEDLNLFIRSSQRNINPSDMSAPRAVLEANQPQLSAFWQSTNAFFNGNSLIASVRGIAQSPAFLSKWLSLSMDSPSAGQFFTALYLLQWFNEESVEAFLNHNIALPFFFRVWRPHMRYGTLAIVKMRRGLETGFMAVKPGTMTMGDDPSTQHHVGMYASYSAPVIRVRKNIYPMHHVYTNELQGGCGNKFVPEDKEYNPLAETDDPSYGDMIVTVHAVKKDSDSTICSVTGYYELFSESISSTQIAENQGGKLCYSMAPFYEGIHNIHGKLRLSRGMEVYQGHEAEQTVPNTICFRGQSYGFGSDGTYSRGVQSTGFWRTTGYGSDAARRGAGKHPANPVSVSV